MLAPEKFSIKERMELDPWTLYYHNDPYVVVYDFFMDSAIRESRENLLFFLTVAFTKNFKDLHKYNLYLFSSFMNYIRLVDAAYRIFGSENLTAMKEENTLGKGFIKRARQIRTKLASWDDFPLYLSPAELKKPRLVIKEFCTTQPQHHWEAKLQRLMERVIESDSAASYHPEPENIFRDFLQLSKLIEAMWLIRILELPKWS